MVEKDPTLVDELLRSETAKNVYCCEGTMGIASGLSLSCEHTTRMTQRRQVSTRLWLVAILVCWIATALAAEESVSSDDVDDAMLEETCVVTGDGTTVCTAQGDDDEASSLPNSDDIDIELIPNDYGQAQEARNPETRERIAKMDRYMHETVFKDPAFEAHKGECTNNHELCAFWADYGFCDGNPFYMKIDCAPACFTCEQRSVEAQAGYLSNDYGVAQEIRNPSTRERVYVMDHYMAQTVFVDPVFVEVSLTCRNKHELCAFWADYGYCETTPAYMRSECGPACLNCVNSQYEERCGIVDDVTKGVFEPGDLNRMFERITQDDSFAAYHPVVHSTEPWVVTLDTFLTKEECEILSQLGTDMGYKRSRNGDTLQPDGTYKSNESEARTSSNTWCTGDCSTHPTTLRILEKISHLTNVPDVNFEALQLLEYQSGQYYQRHNDYIDYHVNRAQGPRILTVFLYLNDVESGGGTRFSDLNITVQPLQGRAIIWPSVLSETPHLMDHRTDHEALVVVEGEKYAANAWLHFRDFKDPELRNCIQ